MRRWPPLVLLGVSLLLAGCAPTATPMVTSAPASPSATTSGPEPSGSGVASTGCGDTVVHRGDVPAWLVAAGGGSRSPSGAPTYLPYVIAQPQIAGAYLFGFPLRAGHPENPTNKILWAMRLPRNGSSLVVSASPLGAASPTVSITLPDDSGPGEIYPSIIDVPFAGCWRLGLSWMGHHAELDLDYA